MKLLWCVAVLVSTFVSGGRGNDDVFEECANIEDKAFLLKEFSDFYGKTLNITSTLTHCCANREKGKKAVLRYYDNRMGHEKKNNNLNREDRKKMVEARGCSMLMVNECRTKRELGLM
ncbi:hypothetical protein JTE90_017386 [Oedothorax gibbosus]|uniref:Uncharacterized protein n=1 Tax=Oedothorax gibbosus TaxID=931172 RepID=A0AAV6VSP2_9ARAC|nr:hypothetical protein JTE90_017386 [Oedothorax gibbosus]